MISIIICFIGMVFYTACGYNGMDKWLAGSGIAMAAIIAIMSLIYDCKCEIVKAIKKGARKDE